MIHIAICDDEPDFIRHLTELIRQYTLETSQDIKTTVYYDGLELIEKYDPSTDPIFLDIQMNEPDGMETARILRERNYRGLVVFVTVLKECVFDAFEVQPFDYLLKPLDDGHFRRTMDRAMESLKQQENNRIVIKKGCSCEVIRLSDIEYCEVQGRKIYIHQRGGRVADCYEKLDTFAGRLDSRFFRCHRSFIVNLGFISGCADGQITLSSGGKIPVSRLRERDLRQALLQFMKERRC